MTTNLTTTRHNDAHVPRARVLPPPPPMLEDVLNAAVHRLEGFLVDSYLNHRGIPEPELQWAQGAHDILVAVLACVPLTT